MTELTITPNYEKKRLKFAGAVAAGEHVAVTVAGGADWVSPDGETQTLRLRVVFGNKLVALFPTVTAADVAADETNTLTNDDITAWDTSGENPVCELNINTTPAAKHLKFGGPCLWILDDPTNHILYGMGECDVLPWPKREGHDEPIDLDGYPDLVDEVKALRESVASKADKANTYTKSETDAKIAAAKNGRFKKVNALPDPASAESNVIYLVLKAQSETGNIYDEYIVEDGAWEKLGTTSGFTQAQSDWNQTDTTAPDFIKNKPSTMPPSAHTHAQSDVTGLPAALDAKRGLGDLGVRGAPYFDASNNEVGSIYFDGAKVDQVTELPQWNAGNFEIWPYPGSVGSYRLTDFSVLENQPMEDFTLTAANNYTATVMGHVIYGVVDELAKTSDLPAASDATPQTDGTGAAGSSAAFARADHVHPTDASRASTNDVALTPVYGGNGQRFSDWTVLRDGVDVTSQVEQPVWLAKWNPPYWDTSPSLVSGDLWVGGGDAESDQNATVIEITAKAPDESRVSYVLSRSPNPVVGYVLGSQSTKPLQPKGDYAPATNIPKSALASAVQASLGLADTAVQPSALAAKADSAALAPAYSASSAYSVGDVVTYNGRRYKCDTAIASAETWTSAHWTEESVQTAMGANIAAVPNKADASKCKYEFNTATVTLSTTTDTNDTAAVTGIVDHKKNAATLVSTVTDATITIPARTDGYTGDLFLLLTVEGSAPSITFTDAATSVDLDIIFGASQLADIDTGRNLVLFSEVESGKWKVAVEHEDFPEVTP